MSRTSWPVHGTRLDGHDHRSLGGVVLLSDWAQRSFGLRTRDRVAGGRALAVRSSSWFFSPLFARLLALAVCASGISRRRERGRIHAEPARPGAGAGKIRDAAMRSPRGPRHGTSFPRQSGARAERARGVRRSPRHASADRARRSCCCTGWRARIKQKPKGRRVEALHRIRWGGPHGDEMPGLRLEMKQVSARAIKHASSS